MANFDILELLKRLTGQGQGDPASGQPAQGQAPAGLLGAPVAAPEGQPADSAPLNLNPFNSLLNKLQPDAGKREALDAGLLRASLAMMAGGGPSAMPKSFLSIMGESGAQGQDAYQNYRKDASEIGLADNKISGDRVKLLAGQAAAEAAAGQGEAAGSGPVDPETGYSIGQLKQLHQAYLAAGEMSAANSILDKIQKLQQAGAEKGMSVGPDGQFRDANGFNAGLQAQEAAKSSGRKAGEAPFETTTDITEYNLYRKQEEDAGRTPIDFTSWSRENKRAGASQNNVTVGSGENGGAFQKKADEKAAERFDEIQANAASAPQMIADMEMLTELGKNIGTGKVAEFKAMAGPYAEAIGVDIEGLGEAQAYKAIVARIAPQMRPAGAGATSDFDAKQYLASLPSLGNSPEGNAVISATTQAIAENKLKAAEIATRAQKGEIKWQDADKEIRDLPNPYAAFKDFNKAKPVGMLGKRPQVNMGAPTRGQIINGFEFQGGNPNDRKNWKAIL